MFRSSPASPWRVGPLTTALGLAAAAGLARSLGAQTDSTGSALRLSITAGPTLAVRSGPGASRLGYALQGAVALVRPASPWRLRADVLYQHVGSADAEMRANGDGSYRMTGDGESSAAAFVNAVFAGRRTKRVVPYLVGGPGLGWGATMRATGGGGMHSDGGARLAAQGGAGLEWARGDRALTLEARVQTVRSASRDVWFTTVPITVGVSF